MIFKDWLASSGKTKETVDSICSRINRIREEYSIEYEFDKDYCQSLIDELTYTQEDFNNGLLPKTNICIKGDYVTGLRSLRRALKLYVDYLSINNKAPHKYMTTTDCIFEGNFSQFNKFIGPAWCKKVQLITKPIRKKVAVCESCRQKKELNAAHVRHLNRLDIIKKILEDNYKIAPDFYRVNLTEFEQKFVDAHKPFNDTFYFLCYDCHKKYDSDDIVESNKILQSVIFNRKTTK